MSIITAEKLEDLRVTLSAAFHGGVDAADEGMSSGLVTEIPATTGTVTYSILSEWPMIREWLGDRQVKGFREKSYQLSDKSWEATIGIDKRDIEDDNLGIFSVMVGAYGKTLGQFFDREQFSAISNGTTDLCYDGQAFFSASHPKGMPGETAITTVSNYDSSGAVQPWYLFDLSKPLKPIVRQKRSPFEFVAMDQASNEFVFNRRKYRYSVDSRYGFGYGMWQMAYASTASLTGDNLDAAITAMNGQTTDEGHKLGVRPTLLVTGSSLRTTARDLIKKQILATGESNVHYESIAWLDASTWLT